MKILNLSKVFLKVAFEQFLYENAVDGCLPKLNQHHNGLAVLTLFQMVVSLTSLVTHISCHLQ
jgi:hypothetical protein